MPYFVVQMLYVTKTHTRNLTILLLYHIKSRRTSHLCLHELSPFLSCTGDNLIYPPAIAGFLQSLSLTAVQGKSSMLLCIWEYTSGFWTVPKRGIEKSLDKWNTFQNNTTSFQFEFRKRLPLMSLRFQGTAGSLEFIVSPSISIRLKWQNFCEVAKVWFHRPKLAMHEMFSTNSAQSPAHRHECFLNYKWMEPFPEDTYSSYS